MATRTRSKAAQPGDRFAEGVCCKVSDEGLYLGRLAKSGEECPAEHTEYSYDGDRVFLSVNQCAILRERLHAK